MPYSVLTSAEARIVRALGRAFFPDGGDLPGSDDANVVEYIDCYLTWMPAQERALVRLMFAAFGAGILLHPPRMRGAWIARWENSPLYPRRVLFQALRSVFTLAYCADADVLRKMGVDDGASILRRRAEAAEAVALTEATVREAFVDHAPAPEPVAAASVEDASSDLPRGARRTRKAPRPRSTKSAVSQVLS